LRSRRDENDDQGQTFINLARRSRFHNHGGGPCRSTAVCGGVGGRRRHAEVGGPTEDPYRGREEGREADVVHHLDCRSGGATGEEAFEKEYPFIQIEFYRGNAENLVRRMLAEYQAKRYDVDLIDGTVSPVMVQRAGLLQRFYSPFFAEYPADLKDSQGFWGSTNLYFLTPGYNTRMVKLNELPKTYQDLLNPRWKGQMMWSTSRGSGAPIFIGNVLISMGQEAGKAYLQKLKGQNIAKSTASNRQILDLTIAGEFPIALHIFNHHAYISKTAGAPVDWYAIEPVTATIQTIALAKSTPHPHAAMLLLDFVLSEKGQKVFQQSNYLPAHPKVPAKQADLKPGGGRFSKALYMTPDIQFDKGNEWVDYFQNQFLK
jgi:ABC-type Fe3+ transport system substrate-binding protein